MCINLPRLHRGCQLVDWARARAGCVSIPGGPPSRSKFSPASPTSAADEWNTLVGEDDPFLEHAFLDALERSGSVGERRRLRAAPGPGARRGARCRARSRSTSRTTATASSSSTGPGPTPRTAPGIRYYPKLVAAIPFTPATGHRLLLARPAPTRAAVTRRAARRGRARSPTRSGPRRCTSCSARRGEGAPRRARDYAAAPEHAVPLAQPRRRARSTTSTTTCRRSGRATASRCARSGAVAAGARADVPDRDRHRARRRATGRRCSAFYSTNVARHGGIDYLRAGVLRDRARDLRAPAGGHAGLPRAHAGRRHGELREGRATCTAATGAVWPSSRCCTSSSATTS